MGRSRGTSALDPSGTASVAPLFCRSSSTLASTASAPRSQRESTLSALRRAKRGGAPSSASRPLPSNASLKIFVKVATSLDKYDARRAGFSAWLLRIAHNAAVDHLRKQRLTPLSDPVEATCDTEQPDLDDGRSLCEMFRALSSAQRDVLLLREVVGLTPREVAKRLGKTEAAVNTCHHRARRAAVRSLIAMGSTPATRSTAKQRAA